MLGERTRRFMAAYSMILGVAYLIIGAIEFAMGLWKVLVPWAVEMRFGQDAVTGFLGLPIDLFGGFSAIVIGATYLGAISLWKGKYESLGFILVATMLSAVFGMLYLLITGADGLRAFLAFFSGDEEWTWGWLTSGTASLGLLRPEIWLFLLSLPLAFSAWKKTKFTAIHEK